MDERVGFFLAFTQQYMQNCAPYGGPRLGWASFVDAASHHPFLFYVLLIAQGVPLLFCIFFVFLVRQEMAEETSTAVVVALLS